MDQITDLLTPDVLYLIGLVLGGMVAGIFLYRFFKRIFVRLGQFFRFRRGNKAEQWALRHMKRDGYTLVEAQSPGEASVRVDGTWQTTTIRIDYIFEKKGKRFGVEVKSGKRAPHPTSAATRRQLLEYFLVYEIDALFLADYERKTMMEIYFETEGKQLPSHP